MYSVSSLFSGCGGLDLGFKNLGFDLVYACDFDADSIFCYKKNIDPRAFVTDVTSPDFENQIQNINGSDVVLGGFPCQGFSKAGPKRNHDERNHLYLSMLRAVEVLKPKIFLAENVDGLSQNFSGKFIDIITDDFRNIGYNVQYKIVDALAFGVPQHRRRIIFYGKPESIAEDFNFPDPTHFSVQRNGEFKISSHLPLFCDEQLDNYRVISDALSDLVELDAKIPDHVVTNKWPQKYSHIFSAIKEGQKLCNVRHSPTSIYTWQIPEVFGITTEREKAILETIAKNRRHKEYGAIPNGNPLPIEEIERLSGLKEIATEVRNLVRLGYLKEMGDKVDLKGAMFCSGLFKRPKWNEPSQTVLTNFHNPRYFLHPKRNRPFTVRECARLQGFPDDFRFFTESNIAIESAYKMIGNAVPPPLSQALAKSVLAFLQNQGDEIATAPSRVEPSWATSRV